MKDLDRIDRIISKLEKLWRKYPQQRIGQLLENYVFVEGKRGDKTSVRLFHQLDETTEEYIEHELRDEE